MSDLVERLRRYKRDRSGYADYCHQAADTIEAQAERVRVLTEALEAALDFAGTVASGASWWDDVWAEHQQKIDALEATQ